MADKKKNGKGPQDLAPDFPIDEETDMEDPFGTPDKPGAAVTGGYDFDIGIEDQKLPEPGKYLVRCANVEKGVSRAGNDQLIWDFVVVDGPARGLTVKSWTALTAEAKWKIVEYVTALGVEQEEGASSLRFNRGDVIGKRAIADLEHRTFEGQTRLSVKKMRPPVVGDEGNGLPG